MTVVLVLLLLALLTGLFIFTIVLFHKREDPSKTPTDIYSSLLNEDTVASVSRALAKPSFGDIGTFIAHEWDYKAGKGGHIQLDNPVTIELLNTYDYVPIMQSE